MSKQIDLEETLGDNDYPVIVSCSCYWERADREVGIEGGWIIEIDQVEPDRDRLTADDGEMPPITDKDRESWQQKAAELCESDAQNDDIDTFRDE